MADPHDPEGRPSPQSSKSGFFTVYKKGQGYYTRLGTALGAMLLITVLGLFAYQQTDAILKANQSTVGRSVPAAVTAVFVVVGAALAWRVMNAPRSADFLIATDSEMKKVNWPSRQELIGSTRVVIIFLFLIAFILFVIDIGAGYVFRLIGLLKF